MEMQTTRPVLLVSGKSEVHQALGSRLAAAGFAWTTADSSSEVWRRIFQGPLHAILIDLTGANGSETWNLCRACAELSNGLVIGLIGEDDKAIRMQALAYGANQCFVSPGDLPELIVYLTAQQVYHGHPGVSRAQSDVETPSLVIDLDRRRVFRDRQPVSLSRIEFALLSLLAAHHDEVVEPDRIRRTLWKSRSRSMSPGMVKQYVWRLRCKIESDPDHPAYLETVRGLGYCLHHSNVVPAAKPTTKGISSR